MIVYLAQAYSKYEQVPRDAYDMHEAYKNSIMIVEHLWTLGFEVFSPIMYTHPFHLAMAQPDLDYVAHDLKMIEGLMKHDTKCSKHAKCIETIPNEYGYYLLIDRDSECAEETCNGYSHKCEEFMGNKFDSGVVCVFAEDCLSQFCPEASCNECEKSETECNSHKDWMWFVDESKSRGAKAEYDFAHAHHIKCIRLTELLEKGKIEECEPI